MDASITVVSSLGYANIQQKQIQHPGRLGKIAGLSTFMLTTHKTLLRFAIC
jgi:hypothetical protein